MELAIDKARQGIESGQSPFGCCIVKYGEVISCEHNVVWKTTDSTAHAEINTIRVACKKLGTIDLSGCQLYSTCEPCPMCFAASHWARIDKVFYGASIIDAQKAGFNELTISCDTMKKLGGSAMHLEEGLLREKCIHLFDLWKKSCGKSY